MAYEESFEDILERCLDRVPDSVDKREGSVIYDAIAPCAAEICQLRIQLDEVEDNSFADTADRDHLIRRAAEQSIIPQAASSAVLRGVTEPLYDLVPVGTRFSLDDLNYVVTKADGEGTYELTCETPGTEGNQHTGVLTPIEYVDGLGSMSLTEVLIPGEDDEETEAFRERYENSFDDKSFGGNCTEYIQRTNAINGVGATKVTPVWNGGGTVKLTILDSNYDPATTTLIDTVQQAIDPTKDGNGVGIAPIGHVVTVETASTVAINITASITFQDGYSFDAMKTQIEDAIKAYLVTIRKAWASGDAAVVDKDSPGKHSSVVRISQIENRILNLEGVVDIADTAINGTQGNLSLSDYEVPVMGVITNA